MISGRGSCCALHSLLNTADGSSSSSPASPGAGGLSQHRILQLPACASPQGACQGENPFNKGLRSSAFSQPPHPASHQSGFRNQRKKRPGPDSSPPLTPRAALEEPCDYSVRLVSLTGQRRSNPLPVSSSPVSSSNSSAGLDRGFSSGVDSRCPSFVSIYRVKPCKKGHRQRHLKL